MVSTHLKYIGQIGSSPQVGAKKENIWNHHLGYDSTLGTIPCKAEWIVWGNAKFLSKNGAMKLCKQKSSHGVCFKQNYQDLCQTCMKHLWTMEKTGQIYAHFKICPYKNGTTLGPRIGLMSFNKSPSVKLSLFFKAPFLGYEIFLTNSVFRK